MKAFWNHFTFEFRTGLRDRQLLMLNYLFPLGFYLAMGAMMTQINPMFTATMLPAMVVFTSLSSMILGLPTPIIEDREAGIYRSLKINGVPALSILAIPALTTMVHTLIAGAIITVTARPLFHAPLPDNWGAFVGITLLLTFAAAGLGALIGVISENTRITVLWSQLIYLPSMLLSGMMVPANLLPAVFRRVSLLLPSTHAMQGYLGLAYNSATIVGPWIAAGVLLAGGVLAFGLALYLFNWDERQNTQRGHPMMAILALAPYVIGVVFMR